MRSVAIILTVIFVAPARAQAVPASVLKCNPAMRALEEQRRVTKIPPDEPGIKHVESDPALLEPRNILMREHIWSNARFPQMNSAITLRLLMTYLVKPLNAERMVEKPDVKEMEDLGKAMNKLHKACRVKYRMWNHPEAQPGYEVDPGRISGLIEGFNQLAFDATYGVTVDVLARRIGADNVARMRGEVARSTGTDIASREGKGKFIDEVFLRDLTKSAAGDLLVIGQLVQRAFESPELEQLFKEYRETIRNKPEDPVPRTVLAMKISDRLREIVRQAIVSDLPHLAPIAGPLAQTLVNGY